MDTAAENPRAHDENVLADILRFRQNARVAPDTGAFQNAPIKDGAVTSPSERSPADSKFPRAAFVVGGIVAAAVALLLYAAETADEAEAIGHGEDFRAERFPGLRR